MAGFAKLQKLGKALMLPIAVLPAAGLLLRLGAEDVFNIPVMSKAGGAVFDNLPAIFSTGIAIGFAEGGAGAAGLAGLVGYYVLTVALKAINEDINMGVLAGIMTGITAGLLYNRFYRIRLPDYLGFFGGKRFVPIVTAAVCFLLAVLFGFIWLPIQAGIQAIGNWIVAAGALGAFVYGTLNRLLIPFGLHHILNNLVWFVFGSYTGPNGTVTGDLNRFFAGDPTAGTFMAGFFPVMMFGLPAACLAMAQTAYLDRRRAISGIMLSMALTSFLTGITEPIEFTFMFLAPVLYGIHAILTGVSLAAMDLLGVKHGFTFSGGAIDYVLNFGLSTRGWIIIPFGLLYSLIYYGIFSFFIRRFDVKTPGRGDDENVVTQLTAAEQATSGQMSPAQTPAGTATNETAILAQRYVQALGGRDNLKTIDSCITRLRLTLVNRGIVSDASLKALGASGVIRPGQDGMQVIVGPIADAIADEMRRIPSGTGPKTGPKISIADAIAPPLPVPPSDGSDRAPSPEVIHNSQVLIQALGGRRNIQHLEVAALTRLRLDVDDKAQINSDALLETGIKGIMDFPDAHLLHLIVGLDAEQYANEMQKQLASHRN